MLGFKENKDDPLFNRRRFMVLMAVYAIIWGFVILGAHIFFHIPVGAVGLFLGYITTLAGAGLFQYFTACNKEGNNDGQR